jgi:hypothetical protein
VAKPPSLVGRAVRWCRRHPGVTAVVVVMALGLAGVFWQWRVAESQRQAAVTAGELVEVADFQREQFNQAQEKKSSEIGKEALELCFTLLILTAIDVQNGNHAKVLAGHLEMQQAASLFTNKQFGAMVNLVLRAMLAKSLGQTALADKEYQQALHAIEKWLGKQHYLYTILELEHAYLLFEGGKYAEAEQKFLNLETSWRSSFGGDALRLADIYYNHSRAIWRGSLKSTSPSIDPQRRKELAARAVHYARAAYDQGKKYGGEPEQMGILGVYLCHTLIHYEPNPDYAAIEAIAREARVIREKLFGVGGPLDTHPLNYLLVALARQDRIEEVERVFLDLLARCPQPQWDGNASYALPEAAAKLARAGKTRTAVLMLEHAATTGLFDLNSIRTEAAFAALRESPDYQELLKKMKAPE